MDKLQYIQVEITPHPNGTCRDCNLLIFDDMGSRPYCAAGHKLVDTLNGYPTRALACHEAEVQGEAKQKALSVPIEPHDNLRNTKYCIVDHRYANSQIRYRLLQWLVTSTMTLNEIVVKSGLSDKHLVSICLGKSDVTYNDMSKLAKALFGQHTELLVTIPWYDCGFSISEENPCREDQECVKLMEQGQREGTVSTKVW